MEEAKTDITYCLKTCDKDCWRKASNYVFKGGENYSFTSECLNIEKMLKEMKRNKLYN